MHSAIKTHLSNFDFSLLWGLRNIYFAFSIIFGSSWTLIFSLRYSRIFSLLRLFTAIVNDTISETLILSSELSKNREVKRRKRVIMIHKLMIANVGFMERMIHESTSPVRDPSQ